MLSGTSCLKGMAHNATAPSGVASSRASSMATSRGLFRRANAFFFWPPCYEHSECLHFFEAPVGSFSLTSSTGESSPGPCRSTLIFDISLYERPLYSKTRLCLQLRPCSAHNWASPGVNFPRSIIAFVLTLDTDKFGEDKNVSKRQ